MTSPAQPALSSGTPLAGAAQDELEAAAAAGTVVARLPRQRSGLGQHARPGPPAPRWSGGQIRRLILVCLLSGGMSLMVGNAAASTVVQWLGLGGPSVPADAAPRPLLQAPPAPAGTGGFAFLHTQNDSSGRPVRWDPCRPIHYVVRTTGAPAGALAVVQEALAEVGAAAGLTFVSDGFTDEAPDADREAMDRDRYGDRWAPVLIAWATDKEYPPVAKFAGLGGPAMAAGQDPGTRRYVSGMVVFNRKYIGETVAGPHGRERMKAVAMHEFSHVAGLDHVESSHSLMYPVASAVVTAFGPGDRRGLAALSNGPCFRDF